MSAHPFDAAIALAPAGEGLYTGATHPAWANMVGPFGGITAATLLNAVCLDPRRLGEPASLTVNYAGPVAEGEFLVDAQAARTNRSTQYWTISLRQGGAVAATASALFALRRDTWSDTEAVFPQVPAAGACARSESPRGVQWTKRYEMRFAAGGWPDFSNPADQPDSLTSLWVRDDPPRALDALSLASLCDVFYPRIFRRRQRVTPAGTVSMTIYFHAVAAALAAHGERPVLGQARAQRFAQGFFDQSAQLWGGPGQLFASSHQLVYYKD